MADTIAWDSCQRHFRMRRAQLSRVLSDRTFLINRAFMTISCSLGARRTSMLIIQLPLRLHRIVHTSPVSVQAFVLHKVNLNATERLQSDLLASWCADSTSRASSLVEEDQQPAPPMELASRVMRSVTGELARCARVHAELFPPENRAGLVASLETVLQSLFEAAGWNIPFPLMRHTKDRRAACAHWRMSPQVTKASAPSRKACLGTSTARGKWLWALAHCSQPATQLQQNADR